MSRLPWLLLGAAFALTACTRADRACSSYGLRGNYADSRFDFVICSHVLEHVRDDRAAPAIVDANVRQLRKHLAHRLAHKGGNV